MKVKVNNIHQVRVFYDAYLVQIWWFQLKPVTSCCADKVKFTARRTDTGNDNTLSAWKAEGKIRIWARATVVDSTETKDVFHVWLKLNAMGVLNRFVQILTCSTVRWYSLMTWHGMQSRSFFDALYIMGRPQMHYVHVRCISWHNISCTLCKGFCISGAPFTNRV